MNLQAIVDAMARSGEIQRANYHMTLGGLIFALKDVPPSTPISTGLANPHSYRGFYSDLAFEVIGEDITAGDLLEDARESLGKTFEGYKGGDFVMHERTPLWVANHGCCGQAFVGLVYDGGKLLITVKDMD
jgi:hypothetical protein